MARFSRRDQAVLEADRTDWWFWHRVDAGSAELRVELCAKLYANLYFSWELRALALNFDFFYSEVCSVGQVLHV